MGVLAGWQRFFHLMIRKGTDSNCDNPKTNIRAGDHG